MEESEIPPPSSAAPVKAKSPDFVGPFSALPPTKVVRNIVALLHPRDIQHCRLVCQNWNLVFTECLTLTVKLSDMTMLPFLRVRRSDPNFPKLYVNKIIVVDMTLLSAPFSPEDLQEQIHCPNLVKTLQFLEGVASGVKKNFLLAFQWIETLQFEKTPVPEFPEGLLLNNLKRFEMSPGAYNESDELQKFFRDAFFPSLEETTLQIHCRNDYWLYASAHFFIAKHHRSLRRLKIMFLESLTLTNCYDMEAYARDVRQVLAYHRAEIEKRSEYIEFVENVKQLQLETLNLWLIDNEEFLSLSLQLTNYARKLKSLDINHPYGYRHLHYDFAEVIQNNCHTLSKLTIPRIEEFDCRTLKSCTCLREFSLGMEFHFYDFESFGSVINVQDFPTCPSIKSVSMGSPMTKADIGWMIDNIPANTFMFIGLSFEEYSLKDILSVVDAASGRKSLMMCVSMSASVFQRFEASLNKKSTIGIRVIYHCKPTENHLGTAHFSLDFDLFPSRRRRNHRCTSEIPITIQPTI